MLTLSISLINLLEYLVNYKPSKGPSQYMVLNANLIKTTVGQCKAFAAAVNDYLTTELSNFTTEREKLMCLSITSWLSYHVTRCQRITENIADHVLSLAICRDVYLLDILS